MCQISRTHLIGYLVEDGITSSVHAKHTFSRTSIIATRCLPLCMSESSRRSTVALSFFLRIRFFIPVTLYVHLSCFSQPVYVWHSMHSLPRSVIGTDISLLVYRVPAGCLTLNRIKLPQMLKSILGSFEYFS